MEPRDAGRHERAYRDFVRSMPGGPWTLLLPPVFCAIALGRAAFRPASVGGVLFGRVSPWIGVATGVAVGGLIGGTFLAVDRIEVAAVSRDVDGATLFAAVVLFPLVSRLTFSLGLQTLLGRFGTLVGAALTAGVESWLSFTLASMAFRSPGISVIGSEVGVRSVLLAVCGPLACAILRSTNYALLCGLIVNAILNVVLRAVPT